MSSFYNVSGIFLSPEKRQADRIWGESGCYFVFLFSKKFWKNTFSCISSLLLHILFYFLMRSCVCLCVRVLPLKNAISSEQRYVRDVSLLRLPLFIQALNYFCAALLMVAVRWQGFCSCFFFLFMSELRLIWKHHFPKHDLQNHTQSHFSYVGFRRFSKIPNVITCCTKKYMFFFSLMFFLPLPLADVQAPSVQSWTKLWICRLAHWSALVRMCEQPVCLEIYINISAAPTSLLVCRSFLPSLIWYF